MYDKPTQTYENCSEIEYVSHKFVIDPEGHTFRYETPKNKVVYMIHDRLYDNRNAALVLKAMNSESGLVLTFSFPDYNLKNKFQYIYVMSERMFVIKYHIKYAY